MKERQEFVEVEGDGERSDYTDAGPYAVAALPLALAIVTSRWEDIERIATAALEVERLTYAEVRRLAAGQVDIGNEYARWEASSQQHDEAPELQGD